MEGKALLSDELKQRVEDFARQQNREPADVVEEALNRYVASDRLFSAKLETLAISRGIREEDVPDLVHEVRRESTERGR
jgi:predicted transcriptional regulator